MKLLRFARPSSILRSTLPAYRQSSFTFCLMKMGRENDLGKGYKKIAEIDFEEQKRSYSDIVLSRDKFPVMWDNDENKKLCVLNREYSQVILDLLRFAIHRLINGFDHELGIINKYAANTFYELRQAKSVIGLVSILLSKLQVLLPNPKIDGPGQKIYEHYMAIVGELGEHAPKEKILGLLRTLFVHPLPYDLDGRTQYCIDGFREITNFKPKKVGSLNNLQFYSLIAANKDRLRHSHIPINGDSLRSCSVDGITIHGIKTLLEDRIRKIFIAIGYSEYDIIGNDTLRKCFEVALKFDLLKGFRDSSVRWGKDSMAIRQDMNQVLHSNCGNVPLDVFDYCLRNDCVNLLGRLPAD